MIISMTIIAGRSHMIKKQVLVASDALRGTVRSSKIKTGLVMIELYGLSQGRP